MLLDLAFVLASSFLAEPKPEATLQLGPAARSSAIARTTPPAPAPAPAPEAAAPPPEPAAPAPSPAEAPAIAEPTTPAPAPTREPTEAAAPTDDDAEPATTLEEVEAEHQEEPDPAAEQLELQPPSTAAQGLQSRRSPVWGRLWLSGSILAGLDNVGLGFGVVRFVLPRLGFGLDVEDVVVFDRGAYNVFQATPKVVFLLLPNRRVTPIASGGFGGAFFSHGLGVYGRWVGGAGLMIAIGERFRTGFGLDIEGLLPKSRFYQSFECIEGSACHIGLSPWISFGFRA